MPKERNVGAITIRPPVGEIARKEFFALKDRMAEEFEANRRRGEGPTAYTELFIELARARYGGAPEKASPAADLF